jgi:hypothetical protein
MSRLLVLGFVLLAIAVGCAGSDSPSVARWAEQEAESITTVRSLPVRVVRCDGLGEAESDGGRRAYARLDCVGGTRAAWETYDTIAVFYVLRPLEEYEGPRSRHRLTKVRFVGGPASRSGIGRLTRG